MGRSSGGSYTLPGANFVNGTTADAAAVNAKFSDLATEMTDSLSRSGNGGMLARLRGVDGTQAAPAYSFTSETSVGFYRAGSADVRFASAGTDVMKWATLEVRVYPAFVLEKGITVTTSTSGGTAVTGNGNGSGVGGNFTGGASGIGVLAQGGASAAGLSATGGTNAPGVLATGGTGNSNGVTATGDGTGYGVLGTGGDSSTAGVRGVGGATNGDGVQGQGTGTGHGGVFTAGSGGADGVRGTGAGSGGVGGRFTGSTSGQGDGVVAVGGAGGTGRGVNAQGAAGQAGGIFTPGTANTASVRQSAIILNGGDIAFQSNTNPSATTAFSNALIPALTIKGWGIVTVSGGTATLARGVNVTSVVRSGSDVIVTWASAFTPAPSAGEPTYGVDGRVLTQANHLFAVPASFSTTAVTLRVHNEGVGTVDLATNDRTFWFFAYGFQ
jgi:hypothetical protein